MIRVLLTNRLWTSSPVTNTRQNAWLLVRLNKNQLSAREGNLKEKKGKINVRRDWLPKTDQRHIVTIGQIDRLHLILQCSGHMHFEFEINKKNT